MSNRRERRTRGKEIMKRLNILKNSQILKDADLSDLPEDLVKQLIAGTCKNDVLQKRYRTCSRILDEVSRLQIELKIMQTDLAKKKLLPKKDV